MTQAVATLRDGFAFQARLFWLQAVKLLDPKSHVTEVGFESGPRGFDDFWVSYDPAHPFLDHQGLPMLREYSQCKWHVSPGQYGHEDLIDPKFINATSQSFLQRAHAAARQSGADSGKMRLKLLTNWRIDPTDPMGRMLHARSSTLLVPKLFGTITENSMAGRVRKLWAEHLGITADALRTLVPTLVFGNVRDSLDDLREDLDVRLRLVGLRGTMPGEITNPYDDIVYQWVGQGRQRFDRKSFRALCEEHRLIEGTAKVHRAYGVKSFEHPIDHLEDRCERTLDLVPHFNERLLIKNEDWAASLYPKLSTFLLDVAKGNDNPRLILDAHVTLAFAAGTVINTKAGRSVQLEQRGVQRMLWEATDTQGDENLPGWDFNAIPCHEGGTQIAVAVGLTHEIASEVKRHVDAHLPEVGLLIAARPANGCGIKSVTCGRHAFELARSLTNRIREARAGARTTTHIFIAGPNGFTFFLGQHQPLLGTTVLYEYDFEGENGGGYAPSLRFPIGL
jgi:hypothetical protein